MGTPTEPQDFIYDELLKYIAKTEFAQTRLGSEKLGPFSSMGTGLVIETMDQQAVQACVANLKKDPRYTTDLAFKKNVTAMATLSQDEEASSEIYQNLYSILSNEVTYSRGLANNPLVTSASEGKFDASKHNKTTIKSDSGFLAGEAEIFWLKEDDTAVRSAIEDAAIITTGYKADAKARIINVLAPLKLLGPEGLGKKKLLDAIDSPADDDDFPQSPSDINGLFIMDKMLSQATVADPYGLTKREWKALNKLRGDLQVCDNPNGAYEQVDKLSQAIETLRKVGDQYDQAKEGLNAVLSGSQNKPPKGRTH